MLTQLDHKLRAVALTNLKAMCEHISGVCHRYSVSKVGPSRIRVAYSNPDEYGNDHTIEAELPCFRSDWDGNDNPTVVLHVLRIIGSHDDCDWQSFTPLWDCPVLYRTPRNGLDHWMVACGQTNVQSEPVR